MVKSVNRYEHVVHAVFNEPWAILPSVYATICEVVRMRAEGQRFTAEEIRERIGAASVRPGAARNGAVAVLPLHGVLAQRMNLMMAMSGGTSTEQFGKALQTALADPEVSAIVMDIDSPGGSVFGVDELAKMVHDSRGQKPIIAQANSLAASAAYYIASQADEVVVTPSGEVGSIGVIAHHQDISGREEMEGVKDTLITYGKNKGLGNPFEPLGEESRADLQKRVNEYGMMFDRAVARGRGVSLSTVREQFGQGLMFGAQEAVKLGMADRVATLQETVDRLMGRGGGRNRAGASSTLNETISVSETLVTVEEEGVFFTPLEVEAAEDPEAMAEAAVDAYTPDEEALNLRARRLRLLDKA